MKLKITIIAVVILGLSSACTQRTCPTYAQEDTTQEKVTTEANA